MAVLRFAGFTGEVRAIEPKLLPDAACTVSINHKPGRGDLRPWRQPLTVATVPAGTKTIYRQGRDVASDANYWFSWNTVVHAMRGFQNTDSTEQTFFTGDGVPKYTDNVIGVATAPYPTAARPLGIPAPTTAPQVASAEVPTGTPFSSRASYYYVYTYRNSQGWESAPSPVSAENTRLVTAPATISGFVAPPPGNYDITTVIVYRTQTGTNTNFYYHSEHPVGTASVTDNNESLQELLETTTWLPAPGVPTGGTANTTEPTLSFLTPMWNGMVAGITNGKVRVCEPYTLYAWPAAYEVLPPDGKAVGLGVFGQNLLILTTSRPVLVNGSGPDGLDQQKIEMPQACVAPQSIVGMGAGVAWASEDGLCWYGSGGPRLLTAGIMLREDWQAINPASVIGRMYEGLYFGSYDNGSGRKGFFIDPSNPTGIYFMDKGFEAMHFDELKDHLYVLDGSAVKKWDEGSTFMTYTARSKVYKAPHPVNYGAAEVIASAYPVTFRLYADGTLLHTESVVSRDPFRLPSGTRALDFQIELSGTGPIQGVAVASTMAELSQV